jgi:hypothetical protein
MCFTFIIYAPTGKADVFYARKLFHSGLTFGLRLKYLTIRNALAYYVQALMTILKSFILEASEALLRRFFSRKNEQKTFKTV